MEIMEQSMVQVGSRFNTLSYIGITSYFLKYNWEKLKYLYN